MLHGAALLRHVGFPAPEILGPDASEAAIQSLIARHGTVFVNPVFKGGVGKKGKAGLVGRATTVSEGWRRRSGFTSPNTASEILSPKLPSKPASLQSTKCTFRYPIDRISCPDHDAHAPRRRRYRRARLGRDCKTCFFTAE